MRINDAGVELRAGAAAGVDKEIALDLLELRSKVRYALDQLDAAGTSSSRIYDAKVTLKAALR